MSGSAEHYMDDLKRLRKQRGLCVSRADQVGATLRERCHVQPDDPPAEVTRKVTEVLTLQAQQLGEQQRRIALTTLGLEGPDTRYLKDREKRLSKELDRDVRTARRYITEAYGELAELLAAADRPPAPNSAAAWHTERLRVLLVLDQPRAEALVFREVVAEAELLEELDLATTITADRSVATHPKDMSVDIFSGGTLVERKQETSERISLALRLPKPLHRGEKHEIVMRFQVTEVAPHYVCVPMSLCAEFDLTVRFDSRSPETVGVLRKVLQNDVRDAAVTGEPMTPNAAGEVRTHFHGLEPGFAYGMKWPATATTTAV